MRRGMNRRIIVLDRGGERGTGLGKVTWKGPGDRVYQAQFAVKVMLGGHCGGISGSWMSERSCDE